MISHSIIVAVMILVSITALIASIRLIISTCKEYEICDELSDFAESFGLTCSVDYPVILSPMPPIITVSNGTLTKDYFVDKAIVLLKLEILSDFDIKLNKYKTHTS